MLSATMAWVCLIVKCDTDSSTCTSKNNECTVVSELLTMISIFVKSKEFHLPACLLTSHYFEKTRVKPGSQYDAGTANITGKVYFSLVK